MHFHETLEMNPNCYQSKITAYEMRGSSSAILKSKLTQTFEQISQPLERVAFEDCFVLLEQVIKQTHSYNSHGNHQNITARELILMREMESEKGDSPQLPHFLMIFANEIVFGARVHVFERDGITALFVGE